MQILKITPLKCRSFSCKHSCNLNILSAKTSIDTKKKDGNLEDFQVLWRIRNRINHNAVKLNTLQMIVALELKLLNIIF